MNEINVLWVDDEIDLLKPHIMFLKQKNYNVTPCNNGYDALELFKKNNFDAVFLDENMPGMGGLEVLSEMKEIKANVPIIMITKSEEEHIMEEAIGSKIADFLIKPVNPNQILLSLKKNLDHTRLVSEKTTLDYQKEFRKISMDLGMVRDYEGWVDIYKRLVFWDMELDHIGDHSLISILESQKLEANLQFFKFIEKNYEDWFKYKEDKPILSHEVFREYVVPKLVKKDKPILFVVIDNLRFDQWRAIETTISNHFKIEKEHMYYAALPTATQYVRNSLFSGYTPLEMEKHLPQYWKNDVDEGGKNLFEKELMLHHLNRLGLKVKADYFKITNLNAGKKLSQSFKQHKDNDLIALVYNFVDSLSHAKTDTEIVKELAETDKSYRSLTQSWFRNSPLLEIIQQAQNMGFKLILTTDHGTINIKNPSKVIGDKNTSLNLRYKTGRNLSYENKDVYAVKNPTLIGLPSINLTSSFIFAKTDMFFAYVNNYNHYVNYYKDTYQHGGVSMEEMLVPLIIMQPK